MLAMQKACRRPHLQQREVQLAVAQLHAGAHGALLARFAAKVEGQPAWRPAVLLPARSEGVAAHRMTVVHHRLHTAQVNNV